MNIPEDLKQDYALTAESLPGANYNDRRVLGQIKFYIERIAVAESENMRLKRPVRDDELTPHLLGKQWPITEAFDALIAARSKGTE